MLIIKASMGFMKTDYEAFGDRFEGGRQGPPGPPVSHFIINIDFDIRVCLIKGRSGT